MPEIEPIESLLDPKDIAKILKVSLAYVYKMAERGLLPCVRWPSVGNGNREKTVLRFKKQDILNFLEKHYK